MNFLEKLDFLMYKNKLNRKKLSELANIPYTTIMGWYKRSYTGMTLSTFKKICDYFGVTMDSMARDEVLEIEYYNPNKKNLHISKDEELLLQSYRESDSLGKELAMRAVKADEKETPMRNQNAG
ncbi:MAG: helix-turn-helix transcriptional regulator [Lachnospiraceae bacterium]|nr:helix-turn-helix transcriptional regulator [Lachnospiraceae bacterium]